MSYSRSTSPWPPRWRHGGRSGRMMRTRRGTVVAFLAVTALVSATAVLQVGPPDAAQAAPPAQDDGTAPAEVNSKADATRAKLHPKLVEQLDSGSTETIYVFATVEGDPAPAEAYLEDPAVAHSDGAGLVVGQIAVQALPKLAGAEGVVAVGPIDFKQTGQPLGSPDPEVGKRPTSNALNRALRGLYDQEVPYSEAPDLAGSNFEELKELAVLDVKTHEFAEAWEAGFTGTGVTVGVMDGGTDFGHPDLVNTWQVWAGQTGTRAGWNGWPKAFDPFGTLQYVSAFASQIQGGLSWYTLTTAAPCPEWAEKAAQASCAVRFATRTGPSRNFSVPAGTAAHAYRFPAGFTKSGNVRVGSHPDDHLLALFGERPAFLVTDPNTPGVYDTVYVDLDNDYRFDDEKPVTKASPASYRDMNGDGYTDLSGGLLYFISDGVTAIPGGVDAFLGPVTGGHGPGQLLAWSGDYDPAIGGHGTLTASNVVGQGVINGLAPTFNELPGGA